MAINVLKIDDWLNSHGVQFIVIDESTVQRIKDGEVFQVGDAVGVISNKQRSVYVAYWIDKFDEDCIHVYSVNGVIFQINRIIRKVKLENGGAKWIKC